MDFYLVRRAKGLSYLEKEWVYSFVAKIYLVFLCQEKPLGFHKIRRRAPIRLLEHLSVIFCWSRALIAVVLAVQSLRNSSRQVDDVELSDADQW